MSDPIDHHAPSDEFVEFLERDTLRIVRREARFGPASGMTRPRQRRRLAVAFGIAAGVVLMLTTGVVLGASASYASAAELDAHQRATNTSVLAATRRLIAGQLSLARANYARVHTAFENGTTTQLAMNIAAAQVDTLERTIAQIELGLTATRAATPTPRPTLAILPIKNALTALGCTQSPVPTQSTQTADAALSVPATAALSTATAQTTPDREKIAALARDHAAAVVRGDSAAEYIVMVLDAADKYVWSTHGTGGLSIMVGGDPRTAGERTAYMREHNAQYVGAAAAALGAYGTIDIDLHVDSLAGAYRKAMTGSFGAGGRGARGGVDSALANLRLKVFELPPDSLRFKFRRDSMADFYRYTVGAGARGGRGGGSDSGVVLLPKLKQRLGDSALKQFVPNGSFFRLDATSGGYLTTGVSPVNAPDGSYRIAWGRARVPTSNAATGLEASGNGPSGIAGLPATAIAMGESYVFPAGELAPQALRIVVVHLASGSTWKGR